MVVDELALVTWLVLWDEHVLVDELASVTWLLDELLPVDELVLVAEFVIVAWVALVLVAVVTVALAVADVGESNGVLLSFTKACVRKLWQSLSTSLRLYQACRREASSSTRANNPPCTTNRHL